MLSSRFISTCLFCLLATGVTVAEDGATIKGKIVMPHRFASSLKVEEIPLHIMEQLTFDPPPLPDGWPKMKPEEQNAWWNKFLESETGKAFVADRKKKEDAAHDFEVRVESSGEFVVYDVPPGIYGLGGRVDKKIAEQDYVFEVFGRLEVVEKTDEVAVGQIEVLVTPLLKNGQTTPNISAKKIDGSAFNLANLKGRPVVMLFWSIESPPAIDLQKNIQAIVEEIGPARGVEFVSLCLDKDANLVEEFLKANPVKGTVVMADGWQGEIAQNYGVRGIPSLWVIDGEQKIAMSNMEFGVALRVSGLGFKDIIVNLVDRKPIPNYPPPPPPDVGGQADAALDASKDKSGKGK